MRECPELRNDLLEEERRCEQQEEEDRKQMEMELQRNPFHGINGISRGNQLPIGQQACCHRKKPRAGAKNRSLLYAVCSLTSVALTCMLCFCKYLTVMVPQRAANFTTSSFSPVNIWKKSTSTPKKLLQKVFQLILLDFSVLYNILKVYQNRSLRKVFFQDGVQDGRRNLQMAISL